MNAAPTILRALRRFAAARPEARRFVARAWLGAPLIEASLAATGLGRTLRLISWAARGPARLPRRKRHRPVGPEEGATLIAGVFRHHLVRGACLPQALLQYALHMSDGVPARLVVGVRRPSADEDQRPLAAHAWVEAEPLPECGSAPSRFAPILIYPAGGLGS
jgi:hypothetical protein